MRAGRRSPSSARRRSCTSSSRTSARAWPTVRAATPASSSSGTGTATPPRWCSSSSSTTRPSEDLAPSGAVMRHVGLLPVALGAASFASAPTAAHVSTCRSAQWSARQAALAAFEKAMPAARIAYFKAHGSTASRAAFVRAQKKKLSALTATANCKVTSSGSSGALPTPLPAPAPPPNEHFVFEDGISSGDQAIVEGDAAYAAVDEQLLIGATFDDVTVFVGATAAWLAQKECDFFGYSSECVAQKTDEYGTGVAAEGGRHGLFLNWLPGGWAKQPHPETQKTIAHELFHALQYQLVNVVNDPVPNSGIRHLGPVWMVEGAAEVLGYRVLGDRHLGYTTYGPLLAMEITRAKAPSNPPLQQLLTVDQDRAAGNPYPLYLVAGDH